jgi:hypothetical protein
MPNNELIMLFIALQKQVNNKLTDGEQLRLDFNSYYGGYRLEIVKPNDGYSVSDFDRHNRLSSKEMIAYIKGYFKGLEGKL